MSYNVFALNPVSNVFSLYQDEDYTWRPMWFLIDSECNLTDTDGIFRSEGKIINEVLANKIGTKLKEVLETGKINEYIEKYEKFKKSSKGDLNNYEYDKELIKEFSNFCINSKGFKIL
jgi:hypothetical protein